VKIKISILREQYEEINKLVEDNVFSSISHGIQRCIDAGLPEIKEFFDKEAITKLTHRVVDTRGL
jgi:hypothetical protein